MFQIESSASTRHLHPSCKRNMAWPKPALIAIEKKTMGNATAMAQKVAILRRFHKRIIKITTLMVEFTHMHLTSKTSRKSKIIKNLLHHGIMKECALT